MKKLLLLSSFVVVFAFTAVSQTPSPTPPPEEDRDVVKITTNLIQVDVTVTDSKGRVVTDLRPEEIEIYENNDKQKITHFSFVNTENKTIEKQAVDKSGDKNAAKNAAVPVPPVSLKPGQVRRTVALVVDDLSLSFESTYAVRQALRKFVDLQMQPDDLVAIIRTGSGIGALQQFTSDKRQLYAAIERVKWSISGRGGLSAFAPIEPGVPNSIRPLSLIGKQPDEDVNEMEQFHEDVFSVGTLGAVNYVVKGMLELPGRKSIILFSDGFKLKSKDGLNYRIVAALKRLTDLANRAGVVISTLDARGLQAFGLTAADNVGDMSAQQIEAKLSDQKMAFFDSQSGLDYLAQVTGGRAIRDQNDLSGGVQKILDDQKSYYLVGYQPDSETFDPVKRRFNTLEVKVTRQGLKVRYRSGFFGIVDEEIKPAPKTPREQILNALVSPFSTGGITVKLTPVFTNDARLGSYVSSLIHVKASDLKFTDEPDGWKKIVFEIVVISLGDNGALVDQLGRTETIRVKGDVYEKIRRDGFVYTVPFPVKKAGAYQMRIALRDAETAKIGSANQFIEVPDLRKNRLVIGGIILQNVDDEQNNKNNAVAPDASSADYIQDTALRQFRMGSAMFYNTVIFNPKLGAGGRPGLKTQVKIFHDQKEVFTGEESDYVPDGAPDPKRFPLRGALRLGMAPGEYVLQITVTDILRGEKSRVKTEWIDFEIIK